MRPILFEIGGTVIPSWHVFFVLAASLAYIFFFRTLRVVKDAELAREISKIESEAPTLFAVCYVSGWFGARALSIFVEQFDVKDLPNFFVQLFTMGPMTFYGGAISAFIWGGTWVLVRGLKFGVVFDSTIPAAVLGLGVGRLGCFLNGDDYGKAVLDQSRPQFFAVLAHGPGGDLFRYPTQLEEGVFSILLSFIGFCFFKNVYTEKRKRYGQIGCAIVIVSAFHRFINEFFRGDSRGQFFGTQLSTSQGIAIAIACLAACFLVVPRFNLRRSKS